MPNLKEIGDIMTPEQKRIYDALEQIRIGEGKGINLVAPNIKFAGQYFPPISKRAQPIIQLAWVTSVGHIDTMIVVYAHELGHHIVHKYEISSGIMLGKCKHERLAWVEANKILKKLNFMEWKKFSDQIIVDILNDNF